MTPAPRNPPEHRPGDAPAPPRLSPRARPAILPGAARPDGPSRDALLRALRDARWAPGFRCAKSDPASGALTFLGDLLVAGAPRPLVLKRLPFRRGLLHALARPLGDSRAWKHSLGAARLRRAGILTGSPLLLLRDPGPPGAHWLVLERLPGEDLARTLASRALAVRDEHDLARRAGALVRTLCAHALFNRDHKLSNIIRAPGGELGLIDTIAIRPRSPRAAERMLAAMLFEGAGARVLPRRTLLMRCLLAAAPGEGAHALWRRLADRLARAGDTTPRVDPLA